MLSLETTNHVLVEPTMLLGQVETDETENWNGKLKAETEKLKTGNGRQIARSSIWRMLN